MADTFKVDLSDVHKKIDKFSRTLQDPTGVFQKTMSDMRSRAPGKVADAVRSQYSIKKAEITPSKKKTDLKKAGRVTAAGDTIATFEIKYEGRMLTPLHFAMKPAGLPENKKYKISQKVKKTRKVLSSPVSTKTGQMVPFLAPAAKGSSRIIPFLRPADSRDIEKALKTVSLPQMIDNSEVRKEINASLGEVLEKRFNHHVERLLDKATK